MPSPLKNITPEKAFDRLQAVCARSEISTGEARQKLFRMGIPSAQAGMIIERLVAGRWIDDRRFTGAFVREKVRFAHWSVAKVRQALMAKGVSRDIIDEATAEISAEDENANLLRLLESAVRTHPERLTDPILRRKLYAAMVRRGFRPSDVATAIRSFPTGM